MRPLERMQIQTHDTKFGSKAPCYRAGGRLAGNVEVEHRPRLLHSLAILVQSVPVSVRHVTYILPLTTFKVLKELLVKSSTNRLKLKLLVLSCTSFILNAQIHPLRHTLI
jgi:hypothetical protein